MVKAALISLMPSPSSASVAGNGPAVTLPTVRWRSLPPGAPAGSMIVRPSPRRTAVTRRAPDVVGIDLANAHAAEGLARVAVDLRERVGVVDPDLVLRVLKALVGGVVAGAAVTVEIEAERRLCAETGSHVGDEQVLAADREAGG